MKKCNPKLKLLLISIVSFFTLAFFAHATQAATYYMRADGTATSKIDAAGHSDYENDVTKCMNVARHNSQTFSDGDVIMFSDKGGTYKGERGTYDALVVPPNSGISVGIKYTNVPGETPTFDMSIPVTGWSGPNTSGVYTKANTETEIFFEDQIILKKASSAANVGVDGNWYATEGDANATLYYKPANGTPSNHVTESTTSGYNMGTAFSLVGKSHITIENMTIKKAFSGIESYSNGVNYGYNTVQGCTISQCARGIFNIVTGNTTGDHISVLNNRLSYCGLSIVATTSDGGSNNGGKITRFTNNVIQGNAIDHNGFANSVTPVYWENVIYDASTGDIMDREAISFQDAVSCTIKQNVLTNGHHYGIFLYGTDSGLSQDQMNNNTIDDNYVNTDEIALYFAWEEGFAGAQGNHWDYNIVNKSGDADTQRAVQMGSASTPNPLTGANYFCNNVIYQGYDRALMIPRNDEGTLIIQNNVVNSTGYNTGYNVWVGSSGSKTYMIDHNIYLTDGSAKFFNGSNDMSFAAWKSSTGYDANSFVGDPLFANATGNFSKATDFQLAASSPAVDKGANVGLTSDFAGTAVPQGSAPDIGAYEYASGGTPPPTYSSADLNQDGSVNATDFGIIKTDFFKLVANLLNPRSDIDADGQVTAKDVGIMMSAWK